jgi:predicted ATP-grasp superfamily ATP-dependent carboligase
MKILITDPNNKHTLGIVRALGKKGIRPFVLASKKWTLCSFSKYCAGEYFVSPPTDSTFSSELLSLLKKEAFDLVIPVGSTMVKTMSEMATQISRYSTLPISSTESIGICLSKSQTYKLAQSLGIACPKTWDIQPESDLNALSQLVNYPCVIKAEREMGISIVRYAQNPDEFQHTFEALLKQYPSMSPSNFIVQDYMPVTTRASAGQHSNINAFGSTLNQAGIVWRRKAFRFLKWKQLGNYC